jgi:hypothetical protein
MAYWRLAKRYGAQVDLPPAKADIDLVHTPVGAVTTTLGAARISQIRKYLRTWPLNFGVITDAQVAALRLWIDGTYGRGPFELWIGAATFPVLVNVTAFDPHPLTVGLQQLAMTLEEVGL